MNVPQTNLELSLWVPDDQVGIVAGGEVALLGVKATQLGGSPAEKTHDVRQLEASAAGRSPEQRQTCRGRNRSRSYKTMSDVQPP